MISTRGNLIWSCKVYAQPSHVRLVLRASADGHVWASVGTADAEIQSARRLREHGKSPKRDD